MGFGVNVKAQEGRARKAAQKEARKRDDERKREETEQKEWQVGTKQTSSKRIEEEARRAAKEQAKQERKRIEDEEARELEKYKKVAPTKTASSVKVTPVRASSPAVINDAVSDAGSSRSGATDRDALSDNPVYSASGIDNALVLMDVVSGTTKSAPLERHPERRVKAAFAAFEEREMPRLKAENPSLRLTQLRERLQRLWAKAPENPYNHAYISHRATKTQEELHAEQVIEDRLESMRLNPQ